MFDKVKLNHFNKKAAEGNPDRIIQDLGISPTDTIADIGSGGGFFTIRFAELTRESGKVYAVDIVKSNLDFIKAKVREAGIEERVEYVLASNKTTNLPEDSIDLAFFRNSFHHLQNRIEYFKNLKNCLKSGGKVAVIDHKKGSHSGPGLNHGTGEGEIEQTLEQAGFSLFASFDYLPGQWFFIYKKAR